MNNTAEKKTKNKTKTLTYGDRAERITAQEEQRALFMCK